MNFGHNLSQQKDKKREDLKRRMKERKLKKKEDVAAKASIQLETQTFEENKLALTKNRDNALAGFASAALSKQRLHLASDF